jgi:hypothetical protein
MKRRGLGRAIAGCASGSAAQPSPYLGQATDRAFAACMSGRGYTVR